MNELYKYCRESNNDSDHRQARIFQSFLIASLLGVPEQDEVRFYWPNGICYRVASFR
jgi:hypothetical protein